MEAARARARTGGGRTHEQLKPLGDRSVLPLRGGSYWDNQLRSGVFALSLDEPRANSNVNIGFRAAFLSQPDVSGLRARNQSGETKGICFPADLMVGKK